MKELKKISLFEPEGLVSMHNLSDEERKAIIAGGINGYCYFYCLEYLGNVYGTGSDINYYMSSYASAYGFSDLQAGGISDMSRIQSFTFSHFNTSTVNINDMSNFLTGSNRILAGYSSSPTEDHAVVITGYNSSNGKYIYQDPTTGVQGEKPASEFRFALGVTGSH